MLKQNWLELSSKGQLIGNCGWSKQMFNVKCPVYEVCVMVIAILCITYNDKSV